MAKRRAAAAEELHTRHERHIRNARLALLVMFPFYFGIVAVQSTDMGFNSEEVIANHFLRITGESIAFFILLTSMLRNKTHSKPNALSFLLICSYIIYAFLYIAVLYSNSRALSITPFVRVAEWIFVLILISQCINDRTGGAEKQAITLIKSIVVLTYGVVAVYLVVFPDTVTAIGLSRSQLGGTAIHPNRLALLASIGIATFGIFSEGRRDRFLFLVSLAVVLLAASRVGYLLMGAALLLTLYVRTGGGGKTIILLISALAAATGLSFVALDSGTQEYIQYLADDENIATFNSRSYIWSAAPHMIGQSPLFGWGFIEGPKQIGSMLTGTTFNATNAQNDILGAWISGGAIGFLFLIAFYLGTAIHLMKYAKSRTRSYLIFILSVFFISSQFEPIMVHALVQPTIILLICVRLLELRAGQRRGQVLRTQALRT